MFLKFKKIVGLAAAVVLVSALFVETSLLNSYINYPRTPNLEEGHNVPYRTKGVVIYITKDQNSFLSWLTWIEIVSVGIVVLVTIIHGGDPFKSRSKKP